MKVPVKSAWGSDDPTKSAFAFLHANALAEAGHDAQIFLLGRNQAAYVEECEKLVIGSAMQVLHHVEEA